MEQSENQNERGSEKLRRIKNAIEEKILLFLDVNELSDADIVWDQDSLSVTLYDASSNSNLLSNDDLRQDLQRYISRESVSGIEEHTIDSHTKEGFISFIKN